jgi:hypothetical protein
VDALEIQGSLAISALVDTVFEGDGYSESRIRIHRSGPLANSATIAIGLSRTGQLEGDMSGTLEFDALPTEVTIPAGSGSTVFYVVAKDDPYYTGNRSVSISASSRFYAPSPRPAVLNIIEDEAVPAGFAAWGNNSARTPELIRAYAIGGAAAPGLQGEAPLFTANSTHTGLGAIVRSVDPKLTVTGEYTTNLSAGPWLSANLTLHPDQTGLPGGFERRFFSIPVQPGETKKFLRLKIRLDQ